MFVITTSATSVPGASATFNPGAGTVTYTPAPGYTGTDSFTYTLQDDGTGTTGGSGTTVVPVSVVVSVPLANDDAFSVDEDMLLTNDVSVNDVIGLTFSVDTPPSNGSLTLNTADGTFTYDPDDDFNGTDTFIYSVSDGSDTDTAVVTITVDAVNDAPVNTVPATQVTPVDTPVVFSTTNGNAITVADVDLAEGATPLITMTISVPSGKGAFDVLAAVGTATLSGDGTNSVTVEAETTGDLNSTLEDLMFTPASGLNEVVTVTVDTSDNGNSPTPAGLDSDTFEIAVGDVTAPTVTDVKIASSFWDSDFFTLVGGTGYSIPDGAGQATPLPWSGMNRIYVDFSEAVINTVGPYVTLQVDSTADNVDNPVNVAATMNLVGTQLEIQTPFLTSGRYLLTMDDQFVRDSALNKLDGEWVNSVSTTSGDGTAGGAFEYRFDILIGDLNGNGEVSPLDFAPISFFLSQPTTLASLRFDANGNGEIGTTDYAVVSFFQGSDFDDINEPSGIPITPPSPLSNADEVFAFGQYNSDDDRDAPYSEVTGMSRMIPKKPLIPCSSCCTLKRSSDNKVRVIPFLGV